MIKSKKAVLNFPDNLGACNTYESPDTTKELPENTFNKFMKKQINFSQKFQLPDDSESFEDDDDFEEYENPNLAIMGYDPEDEKRVCKFLFRRGGCWKGTACTFSHEPLNPEGWTRDKELVYYRAFNSLDLPGPGITARVNVKHIKDMKNFFVQIKSFPDMYIARYRKFKFVLFITKSIIKTSTLKIKTNK